MTAPTPILMFGAAGRMGRMILEIAASLPAQYAIVGAVEHDAHPALGAPLNHLASTLPADLKLSATLPAAIPAGTVAIHFSMPEGTLKHVAARDANGRVLPAVIGTTGLTAPQIEQIKALSSEAPLILTPNTSTGVNLLFWLAREAARLSGPDFDMEVVEVHHHHKKDAPSGTARRLAEVALEARGGDYERDVRHGRDGLVGARTPGELGMHAVRAGDVVGEHTLILAGPGERLELTHRAHTRETFARGALRAATWLGGRAPGWYSMNDVLGL